MGKRWVPGVLIVEDSYPFSKIIRQTFARRGFAVFCAASPGEGLALFQTNRRRIDLMVVDIMTPAAANLDLTAELVRRQPGLSVLYLVSGRKTIVRSSIEAQAPASVLVAPFTEEQLFTRVDGLLDIAAASQIPDGQLWERLVAASDRISSGAAMLCLYEPLHAPLAARHRAALTAGGIQFAFQPTNDQEVPYTLIVPALDSLRAQHLIAGSSVGARLVPAA